jgi:vacuolar-type H+-ATPase subunit E/Vma4
MIKLLEPKLLLKVREEDLSMIGGLIEELQDYYSTYMMEQTDREYACELEIMTTSYLPRESGGGVILCSTNRKIVCTNTLQSRLTLCYEGILPELRSLIFPRIN